jgi:hypothetical protein
MLHEQPSPRLQAVLSLVEKIEHPFPYLFYANLSLSQRLLQFLLIVVVPFAVLIHVIPNGHPKELHEIGGS